MRVIHVITRLIVGGAQENTIETVLGLNERPGLDVSLVAGPTTGQEGTLERRVAERGLLTLVPSLVRPVSPWRDLQAYRSLCAHFRAKRPELVHTHSGKAGILGRLAARRAGVRLVVHSIHGPSFGPFQGWVANTVFRSAEQLAARCTDHFVVVADAMTRQYLAAGIAGPAQYTRVFSGFPLEPYLRTARDPGLAQTLGLQPGDFVVGTIARLFELKGHDDLLAAAPRILAEAPAAKFLWVGDGPLRSRLADRARGLGLLDRVIFAGLVPPEEVPRYVGLMDCLAHLSRREGLPRALPQALAAAKPVIAYDSDGAGEVCVEGQTGFLLPIGDTEGVARAVVALAGSPELRTRLGRSGREWVAARFSLSQLVAGQFEVYRRLAVRKGIPFPDPTD